MLLMNHVKKILDGNATNFLKKVSKVRLPEFWYRYWGNKKTGETCASISPV